MKTMMKILTIMMIIMMSTVNTFGQNENQKFIYGIPNDIVVILVSVEEPTKNNDDELTYKIDHIKDETNSIIKIDNFDDFNFEIDGVIRRVINGWNIPYEIINISNNEVGMILYDIDEYDDTLSIQTMYLDFNDYFQTTSINEETNINFNIYPNPMTNILNIDVDKETDVTITNINGQIIYSDVVYPTINTIDVSTYRNGIYFVKIGNKTAKIVKS